MTISIGTPALLFPAISLLLLAYTNRFLGLSALIRSLYAEHQRTSSPTVHEQIIRLKKRVHLIKNMQAAGVLSILFCTIAMVGLFFQSPVVGAFFFGISLFLLIWSLLLSFYEIHISVNALNLLLEDMSEEKGK